MIIFEVPHALAINQKEGREIHFSLPHRPRTYDRDIINQNPRFVLERINELGEKAWVEIAVPEQPLRAPSGGCLDIITDSQGNIFVAMEQRDNIPGIRAPGFQNPWLGYPNSLRECFEGDYMLRETNEECFVSRKYIPIIGRKGAKGFYAWKQTLLLPTSPTERKYVLTNAERLGLNFAQESLATSYQKLNDRYCVYRQKQKKGEIPNCSFTWWPTPDILLAREVSLPVSIEEVLIYHESRRGILVVRIEELTGKKFGDEIDCIVMREEKKERISEWDKRIFKPTSSLKGILSQLEIYPNDWLEETRELLSLEEYYQLWKEDPNRDPFTIENILWERGKHP